MLLQVQVSTIRMQTGLGPALLMPSLLSSENESGSTPQCSLGVKKLVETFTEVVDSLHHSVFFPEFDSDGPHHPPQGLGVRMSRRTKTRWQWLDQLTLLSLTPGDDFARVSSRSEPHIASTCFPVETGNGAVPSFGMGAFVDGSTSLVCLATDLAMIRTPSLAGYLPEAAVSVGRRVSS